MAREFASTSSQYLSHASAPATVAPLTMACWFYYTGSFATDAALMSLAHASSDDEEFSLYINDDPQSIRALVRHVGSSQYATTTAGPSTNTWQHACSVFAASNDHRAFLNGGNKGTNVTAVAPVNIDRIAIACRARSSLGNYHDGRIGEATIWNVALTDVEVAVLATSISSLSVRPGNIVFYVPLVRDNDEDIVGGLSLTANGSPTIATHVPMIYPAPPIFYMRGVAEEEDEKLPDKIKIIRSNQLPIHQLQL